MPHKDSQADSDEALQSIFIFFKISVDNSFNADIITFVDARKCRNWQTSKTKDLVAI